LCHAAQLRLRFRETVFAVRRFRHFDHVAEGVDDGLNRFIMTLKPAFEFLQLVGDLHVCEGDLP
jgi:hypothetical protein